VAHEPGKAAPTDGLPRAEACAGGQRRVVCLRNATRHPARLALAHFRVCSIFALLRSPARHPCVPRESCSAIWKAGKVQEAMAALAGFPEPTQARMPVPQ